ncbi:MAG: hypothetical protein KAV87_09840 [Desulfobacteraceae bacterium]|nr:hypothetical protein [Desulfobacteraceae bacterium]
MKSIKDRMDAIYGGLNHDAIPWNLATPPGLLVELVNRGWVLPCETVDLGKGGIGQFLPWYVESSPTWRVW